MPEQTGFSVLFDLLSRLKNANIYYYITVNRNGVVTINAAVPGQRWEIDVADNGDIEIEVFSSNGQIGESKQVDELISEFADY